MNRLNLRRIPKKELIKDALVVLVILALIGILVFYVQRTFESPANAAEKLKSLGALGPLVIIVLIIFEVMVAPIPGSFLYVASGFAFGTFWGTLFSYIGQMAGTLIAFYISRRFGRPIVERLVKKEKLDYYDCFFHQGGKVVLGICYLLPVFPVDIMTFVTGLSSMKWKKFIIIPSIAFIPNILLHNYFGAVLYESGVAEKTLIFGLAFLFILLISALMYLYTRKKIMKTCKK
ncbi:MAG: TVP38/TMEM64 family protein [Candidatus Nanoarchaeia archaeon]